jgi:hypothetical protein
MERYIRFMMLKVGFNYESFQLWYWTFIFHKILGISCLLIKKKWAVFSLSVNKTKPNLHIAQIQFNRFSWKWLNLQMVWYIIWNTGKKKRIFRVPLFSFESCINVTYILRKTRKINWLCHNCVFQPPSQNWETRLLASSSLFVCPCLSVRMEKLGSHWMDLH